MKNYIIRFTGVLLAVLLVSFCIVSLTSMNKETKVAAKPTIAHTEQLETYEYIVTSIDSEGVHGKSTTDDTGIFLTHDNVKGLSLHESDKIKVSFPNDQWDIITKVVKVN